MSGPVRAERRSPGWYADAARPGAVRWFDGDVWTEHRRPDPRASGKAIPTAEAVPSGLERTWTPGPRARIALVLAVSVLTTCVVGAVGGHDAARSEGSAAPHVVSVTPPPGPDALQLVADTGWSCAEAVDAARRALVTEMSSQRVVAFDDVRLDVDHQGTRVAAEGGALPVLRCTATGTFATNVVGPVAVEITYADGAYRVQVRLLVDDPGPDARSSRVHPLTEG